MHARFLVAHIPDLEEIRGLLVVGSFDFNEQCYSRERYDAGIKTKHPDLIKCAIDLFEKYAKDLGIYKKLGFKVIVNSQKGEK